MRTVAAPTAEQLIERVLLGDALRLQVVHYVMSEYVGPEARCRVTLTVRSASGPKRVPGRNDVVPS